MGLVHQVSLRKETMAKLEEETRAWAEARHLLEGQVSRIRD